MCYSFDPNGTSPFVKPSSTPDGSPWPWPSTPFSPPLIPPPCGCTTPYSSPEARRRASTFTPTSFPSTQDIDPSPTDTSSRTGPPSCAVLDLRPTFASRRGTKKATSDSTGNHVREGPLPLPNWSYSPSARPVLLDGIAERRSDGPLPIHIPSMHSPFVISSHTLDPSCLKKIFFFFS